MGIERQIRKATCRVDSNNQQLGTAFWVSDDRLVTAAHVVDAFDGDRASIQTVEGDSIQFQVVSSDPHTPSSPGTDLALIEADSRPDDQETLDLVGDIPPVGGEVVWSGYARLFGEPKIDRQRFGWGKVASTAYGPGDIGMFEVDGLFNPSHSGGPVVSEESGKVVGVVSASAGAFEKLEDAWAKRANLLGEILQVYKMSVGESGFNMSVTPPDPGAGAALQVTFDQADIDYDVTTNNGQMEISFYREELPGGIGTMLNQMSQLLLDTAQSTFQMGVGISSGGDPLTDLLSSE